MIEKLPHDRKDCGIAAPKAAINRSQTSSNATRSNQRMKSGRVGRAN